MTSDEKLRKHDRIEVVDCDAAGRRGKITGLRSRGKVPKVVVELDGEDGVDFVVPVRFVRKIDDLERDQLDRPGRGRPKLPEGERRETVTIRLTPAELEAIDTEADRREWTRSELICRAIGEFLIREGGTQ